MSRNDQALSDKSNVVLAYAVDDSASDRLIARREITRGLKLPDGKTL